MEECSPKSNSVRKTKPIYVDGEMFERISNLKLEIGQSLGIKGTANLVVQHWRDHSQKYEDMKIENEKLQKELDTMQMYVQDLLKQSIYRGGMHLTSNQFVPSAPAYPTPPPPPPRPPSGTPVPPPKIQPLEIDPIDFAPSEDLKSDLAKESKLVFNGSIRRPSEILQLCCPDHKDGKINEFDGEEPDLLNKSYLVQLMKEKNPALEKFRKKISI
ncbi:hypothetical protein [Candidatus Lokiarchaeum ossiferum]|uniref:hypothetical protein n=1 Tax=Candidatus Lokiarchaeum ossiferum TaxID=2951803 RepID=UPI00352C19E5